MSLHPQYFCLSGWGWSSTIIYPWNMLKQTQTWNVQSLNEMSLSMIEVDSLSASNVHCKLQSSPHCYILFHILCCLSIQYKNSRLDSFASVLLFASHSTLTIMRPCSTCPNECHLLSGKHLMSAALWKRKITSTKLDFHTKAWSNSSETQASSLRNLHGKVTTKLVGDRSQLSFNFLTFIPIPTHHHIPLQEPL